MQCNVQESSPIDAGEMAWSHSPHQESNMLFPHHVGSVDSCPSWPGLDVWRREPSKYWLDSDMNNNNHNFARESIVRVSCSSECSDISSTDEISLSDYSEDSDNNNTEGTPPTILPLGKGETNATIHPTSCPKEDQNNNIDQDSNNNINIDIINNGSNLKKNSTKKSDNPSRERLLDDEGYIRRAACVCLDETESKVLLVSSKKDPCSWLVPGGGMEAGEEMATAAIREAWEEAGVQGHITRYLGLFETKHHDGHKKHRTAVFVVSVKQVMTEYPEAYLGRGRQWFTIEDALVHLARTRPLQSAYLQLLLVSRLKVAAA